MKKFLQLIIIDIISLSNSKIAQDFCPSTFIPPSGLLPASWETTRCKRTPSFYNKLPGISRNSGKLPSSETTHIPPNLSEDGIVLFLVRWDKSAKFDISSSEFRRWNWYTVSGIQTFRSFLTKKTVHWNSSQTFANSPPKKKTKKTTKKSRSKGHNRLLEVGWKKTPFWFHEFLKSRNHRMV